MPRLLVACEYSGVVRDAFIAVGWDAMSCDLLPTNVPGPHYQGPVQDVLDDGWDMMIGHPPCTHLALSGSRWFKSKEQQQKEALAFFRLPLDAPVERIALENPKSIAASAIRSPDCIIHPWQFGHGECKETWLWLKNLAKLQPENIVSGREKRVHNLPPSPDRWKLRSTTYHGIAAAMARQWGTLPQAIQSSLF